MNECNAERDLIFGEITRERASQDEEWGGATHDDSHERYEWAVFIRKQNNLGEQAAYYSTKAEEFESRMVKVAALALAAIESSRRQRDRPRG